MLGLQPWPEQSPLRAKVTGQVERNGVVVEKLHFQSRPGLYVTANLYRPARIEQPLPAVLYLCGHGATVIDGVSYGNKIHYQHHGAWLARNGYVCLMLDSLQLGEIEGVHHGTHRYDMWWWLCRGYTPAGVEAWNCIRALDYLETRKEVDSKRIGVTGRSGGGAYSWWIAALDDRIQAAVPVAGITDLQNHVVDGCVEGHCDCMFMLNTFRWDYPLVAALVAPRPLLISNTDRDSIFPLDGVVRTFEKTRRIYTLLDAKERLGLNISPGPHQDTQQLRVHAFGWLNRYLRADENLITDVAEPQFQPAELKVFDSLPSEERNTTAHEWFVPAAEPASVAETKAQWDEQRQAWHTAFLDQVFRGWPTTADSLDARLLLDRVQETVRRRAYVFTSQRGVQLPLLLVQPASLEHPAEVEIRVLDAKQWQPLADAWPDLLPLLDRQGGFASQASSDAVNIPWPESLPPGRVVAYLLPRGIGPTAWSQETKKQVQIRRRFYLLGQTLDGMRCWDVRRGLQLVRALDELRDAPIRLTARGQMAGVALYATLFEPPIQQLDLQALPATHRDGPYLLNVQRILDLPQTVAMVAQRLPFPWTR